MDEPRIKIEVEVMKDLLDKLTDIMYPKVSFDSNIETMMRDVITQNKVYADFIKDVLYETARKQGIEFDE